MRKLVVFVAVFVVILGGASAFALDEEKQQKLIKVGAKDGPARMDKALLHDGVYFKNLKDGQKVPRKFKVEFGVRGMVVKPAGQLEVGSGHHHILVNMDEKVLKEGFPKNQVIPTNKKHIHFGGGQTETELELPPGKHTLTLQFANGAHLSYGKAWSKTITVVVED